MLILLSNRNGAVEATAFEGTVGGVRRVGEAVAVPEGDAAEVLRLAFESRGGLSARGELARCNHQSLHPVLSAWVTRQVVYSRNLGDGGIGPAK